MGRHRKRPTRDGVDKVENDEVVAEDEIVHQVERRLGLTKQVCVGCDARNAERADRCRKCGSTDLRRKAREFADA